MHDGLQVGSGGARNHSATRSTKRAVVPETVGPILLAFMKLSLMTKMGWMIGVPSKWGECSHANFANVLNDPPRLRTTNWSWSHACRADQTALNVFSVDACVWGAGRDNTWPGTGKQAAADNGSRS